MNKMIEILLITLHAAKDENMKAMLLQSYIAEFGPIPDEYGEIVKNALVSQTE